MCCFEPIPDVLPVVTMIWTQYIHHKDTEPQIGVMVIGSSVRPVLEPSILDEQHMSTLERGVT